MRFEPSLRLGLGGEISQNTLGKPNCILGIQEASGRPRQPFQNSNFEKALNGCQCHISRLREVPKEFEKFTPTVDWKNQY